MTLTMPLTSVLMLSLLGAAAASMYDVIQPTYLPAKGCVCSDWSDLGAAQKVSGLPLLMRATTLAVVVLRWWWYWRWHWWY